MEYKWEDIGGIKVAVTPEHKFGTDAFLLANYCGVKKGEKACDLGTGCGIIPLIWLKGKHKPRVAYGVELQRQGVLQMWQTIKENNLEGRLYPIHQDLNNLGGILLKGSFDLVSCNPPYKAGGRGIINPHSARRIARHETDCTLEDVCGAAASLLRFGGRFCLCQRPERLTDVFEAMRKSGIEPKRLRFVQQHSHTAPWLFLCEGTRGGKPFLKVEPPLIIENPKGGFSQELLKIYGKIQEREE